MVYDEDLARLVRDALPDDAPIREREMFGGLSFVFNGHMACGIVGDALMLRLGPDGAQQALNEPHVRPMDFTGRAMKGMVFVDPPDSRRARFNNGSTERLHLRAVCHQSPHSRRQRVAGC